MSLRTSKSHRNPSSTEIVLRWNIARVIFPRVIVKESTMMNFVKFVHNLNVFKNSVLSNFFLNLFNYFSDDFLATSADIKFFDLLELARDSTSSLKKNGKIGFVFLALKLHNLKTILVF